MARSSWVWDREKHELVPKEEFYARHYGDSATGPQIIRDVEPYLSVIDKSVIGGRRQHRDHLKAHGCIEVGNEYKPAQRQEMSRNERIQDIKRSLGE